MDVKIVLLNGYVESSLEVGRPKSCEAAPASTRRKCLGYSYLIPSRKRSHCFIALPSQCLIKTLTT